MNANKEQFLEEITEEIHSHWRQYRTLNLMRWIVMGGVAVAGVLTTVAASPQGQSAWFASANALVAWGSITTIGTLFNQFGNPAKNMELHLQTKCALKGIRGAVQFRDLPLDQAEQLRLLARKNPEDAIERLGQWQSTQAPDK